MLQDTQSVADLDSAANARIAAMSCLEDIRLEDLPRVPDVDDVIDDILRARNAWKEVLDDITD